MSAIPFVPRIDDAPYATVEQMSPLVQRVIAQNPSKFTYRGTGTYIIGSDAVVVIDPGPRLESHQRALEAALAGRTVVGIAVTHCHADHSPLAEWLKSDTGCPTYAIGPHSDVLDDDPDDDDDDDDEDDDEDDNNGDAPDGAISGSEVSKSDEPRETIDRDFVPDVVVADGDELVTTHEFTLTAVATPGHTSNHMCVALSQENSLFTGDHVMGWSTTVVSPPDGDMRAYMMSLEKVRVRGDAVLWPTHGGPITDPQPFLAAYISHRRDREAQIVSLLQSGPRNIRDLVSTMYVDVDKKLHKPARRSVWSHLIMLCDDNRVRVVGGGPARKSSLYEPTS